MKDLEPIDCPELVGLLEADERADQRSYELWRTLTIAGIVLFLDMLLHGWQWDRFAAAFLDTRLGIIAFQDALAAVALLWAFLGFHGMRRARARQAKRREVLARRDR
jgi:hypothetical protein